MRITSDRKLRTAVKDIDGLDTGKYIHCNVQSSNLNEELGQVNYVFSDKTGTLTTNKMEFKNLLMIDSVYGEVDYSQPLESGFELHRDENIVETLLEATDKGEKLRLIMKCLSVCHDAIFDHTFTLNSSSPEELAFLKFADLYNYKYQQPIVDGKEVTIVLEEMETENMYMILEKFMFTSDRKRMSVVVDKDDEIYMFTKGADDIIKEYLKDPLSEELEQLDGLIQESAKKGYRTMMLAYKKIDKAEWENFHALYKKAELSDNAIEDIQSLQAELEKDLLLLGAISLEDKLQENVAESVKFIREADIKFWVITGDKTETAISVSKSAGIVSENMEIIRYTDPNEIRESNFIQIDRRLKALSSNKKVGSIVSGKFLTVVHDIKRTNLILYKEFVDLLMRSEVAVFSRISPKQKQDIVRMVREHDKTQVTLAIGDGANDVNMINAAHVGIGIRGIEGQQAARASDYNFGEFKHLVPLMFYYGRECYRKNANLVLYNFYKNVMIVMPQFWFGFFNFFSGQTLYEAYTYQNFNTFFTFLPIFLYGVFDKSHSREKFLFASKLYKTGHNNVYFNLYRFIINFVVTVAVSFYLCLAALAFFDWGAYEDGYTYGFWNFGNMVFMAVVIIVNARIISISNSYSALMFIFIGISIGMFYLIWFLLSYWNQNELYNTFFEIFEGKHFYLYLIVILGVCVFEYLFEKLDYHFNIVKYESDYQKTFDNTKLSHVDEFDVKKDDSYHHIVQSRTKPYYEDTVDDTSMKKEEFITEEDNVLNKSNNEDESSFYTNNSENQVN